MPKRLPLSERFVVALGGTRKSLCALLYPLRRIIEPSTRQTTTLNCCSKFEPSKVIYRAGQLICAPAQRDNVGGIAETLLAASLGHD